jgi:hypothetical protein
MYGDFSRDGFTPAPHTRRVLLQQGRPLTDADWNEQFAILFEQQRQFIAELTNWHGTFDGGFAITASAPYTLQAGHYYVDGLRCKTDNRPLTFPETARLSDGDHLLFLEVVEESVSPADDPQMLEPSLAGVDTCWRTRIAWRLRALPTTNLPPTSSKLTYPQSAKAFAIFLKENNKDGPPVIDDQKPRNLSVRLQPGVVATPSGACDVPQSMSSIQPQLYRVEIHRGTPADTPADALVPANRNRAGDTPAGGDANALTATFKWSQDNGAFVYSYTQDGKIASGRYSSTPPLSAGMCVEWRGALRDATPPNPYRQVQNSLHQIKGISDDGVLELDPPTFPPADNSWPVLAASSAPASETLHLRRWDHPLTNTSDDLALRIRAKEWIPLAQGIEVSFNVDTRYLPGDYWLIRLDANGMLTVNGKSATPVTISGQEILEVKDVNSALRIHYAPLARASVSNGTVTAVQHTSAEVGLGQQLRPLKPADLSSPTATSSPAPAPSPAGPPPAAPAPMPAQRERPPESAEPPIPTAQSLLSPRGEAEFRLWMNSPQDLSRRLFASELNFTPESPEFAEWLATAFISELAGQDVGALLDRLWLTLPPDHLDRDAVQRDVVTVVSMANEFVAILTAETERKQFLE